MNQSFDQEIDDCMHQCLDDGIIECFPDDNGDDTVS
jgi:hypothetical protein